MKLWRNYKIENFNGGPSVYLLMGYYMNIVNNLPVTSEEYVKEYIKLREQAR